MILTKVLSKETGNCESGTSKPCFTSVNESSLHEEVSTSSTEIQTDEESACEREQDGIGILTNEPFIVSFDAPHMASFSHSSKIPSLQSYDKQNTGGSRRIRHSHTVPPTNTLTKGCIVEHHNTLRTAHVIETIDSISSVPSTQVLKSALRSTRGKEKVRPARGVKGLWNESVADPFAVLQNDLLLNIVSFVDLTDQIRLTMVSKRWQTVANLDRAWRVVDATKLVDDMFSYHYHQSKNAETAADRSSSALAIQLDKHSIKSLTIRSIGNRLNANKFLPLLSGVQALTLDNFLDLTDTHVHVMLLGISNALARCPKDHKLQKLHLQGCPRLTNAVVRYIALHCPDLEELSLEDCSNISDLTPLRDLWRFHVLNEAKEIIGPLDSTVGNGVVQVSHSPPNERCGLSSRGSPSLLNSLFDQTTSNLTDDTTVGQRNFISASKCLKIPRPVYRANDSTESARALKSLFDVPGSSPPRTVHRVTVMTSVSNPIANTPRAALRRINVSGTSVTAKALLQSMNSGEGAVRKYQLESIQMRRTSTWHNHELAQLFKLLDNQVLKVIQIQENRLLRG